MTDIRNSDRKDRTMLALRNQGELPESRDRGKCCLCPRVIGLEEVAILIYAPQNKLPSRLVARAHLTCFEEHPIQYLNLLKRHLGIVAEI